MLPIFMRWVMQIGLVAPQQGRASLVSAHSLVQVVFLGVLRNNPLCSTITEITGLTFLLQTLVLPWHNPHNHFVIMSVPFTCQLTLCFIQDQSTLSSTTTLSEKRLQWVILSHDTSLHHLSLLISSPSHYPRLPFRCSGTNWVFNLNHTLVWGGMLRIQLKKILIHLKRIKSPSYRL